MTRWALTLVALPLLACSTQATVTDGAVNHVDLLRVDRADAGSADAAGPPAANLDPIGLSSTGGRLVDGLGREVLLRGINARVQGIFDVTFDDGRLPLEPIPPFGADDCRFLADELGMNLLRLPINWSGIEPRQAGEVDAAYLDGIRRVLDACHAAGVYTLLDLHQDAYSKEIGEDGAPLWAIVPPPTMLLGGPLGDLNARRVSGQVLAAFQSLYQNQAGLLDAYADMAAAVATAFADHPGVIGLELMNEPVVLGDSATLDAFHARVAERVRAAAPAMILHFEPDSLRNLTDSAPVTTPVPFGNAVYAPHVYTQVFTDGWMSQDPAVIAASVAHAREEADAHHAALLVGEFGHDPKLDRGLLWIATVLDELDRARSSSAFWVYEEESQGQWGLYDSAGPSTRGGLRAEIADLLARPYVERAAGPITSMAYDGPSRRLTVELAAGVAGVATVISAPRRTYPTGIRVRCADQDVAAAPIDGRAARFAVECSGGALTVEPAP